MFSLVSLGFLFLPVKFLRIWDLHEEKEVKCVPFKGKVETLALSASGNTIALTTIDHHVRVFDLTQLTDDVLRYQVGCRGCADVFPLLESG